MRNSFEQPLQTFWCKCQDAIISLRNHISNGYLFLKVTKNRHHHEERGLGCRKTGRKLTTMVVYNFINFVCAFGSHPALITINDFRYIFSRVLASPPPQMLCFFDGENFYASFALFSFFINFQN